MELFIRLYVIGPMIHRFRLAKAKQIREEIAMLTYASGITHCSKTTEIYNDRIKELRTKLHRVLTNGAA